MRRFVYGWWLVLLAGASGLSQTADKPADKLRVKATAFLECLHKGEFARAAADFDETMNKKLPVDKLEELWKTLTKQLGSPQKFGPPRSSKADQLDVVLIACHFKELALDARLVFAADGRITGLFFVPAATGEYKAPAYVKLDQFRETEVHVGQPPWQLPGTLTMPHRSGLVPAVVLVHGSGPNDRDESIFAQKPFRDLAWGLATQGIAVLRYEKRTREYGDKMTKATITLKEEVLDDALAAAALLRKTPGVDTRRVFVLGHSLGAMMAPRLGTLEPELAGLILLASPTRLLEDVIVEQFTYLYSLGGEPTEKQKADLEKLKQQVARLKQPDVPKDIPAADLPLGMPLLYWRSLREHHPPAVAPQVKQPMLILQGERDYQVTMEDFAGWQKLFASHQRVTLKCYPKLNHLFVEGEGKSTPAEYRRPGHVAQEVIEDVARWILKQP